MTAPFFSLTASPDAFPTPRAHWRQKAEEARPPLQHRLVRPVREVRPEADAAAWYGVRLVPAAPGEAYRERHWARGTTVCFDFGEHLVGHLKLRFHYEGGYADSPLTFRILVAEFPFELTYRHEAFTGSLSEGWIQSEEHKFYEIPPEITLENCHAGRYVRLEILTTAGGLRLDRIAFDSTSVCNYLPAPPPALSPREAQLFTIACRTLRDCMQGVFLDGPKRDRRLWLGDLYVQTLGNARTYRNQPLLLRSLYLLAANCDAYGLMPACAFENPAIQNTCFCPDYALLLAPLLVDAGELLPRETLEELYPLACRQAELYRHMRDETGLHPYQPGIWFFIDHQEGLDKETPMEGVYLFSLHKLASLAQILSRAPAEIAAFQEEYRHCREALRHRALTPGGLLASGPRRQLSLASQVWGVLGGVFTREEARRILPGLTQRADLLQTDTPFLHHFHVMALLEAGLSALAREHVLDYWGGMAELGADTFWERFSPSTKKVDLYDDPMLCSACHAWSCTPAWFFSSPTTSPC